MPTDEFHMVQVETLLGRQFFVLLVNMSWTQERSYFDNPCFHSIECPYDKKYSMLLAGRVT